jgi:hypothetical protein
MSIGVLAFAQPFGHAIVNSSGLDAREQEAPDLVTREIGMVPLVFLSRLTGRLACPPESQTVDALADDVP